MHRSCTGCTKASQRCASPPPPKAEWCLDWCGPYTCDKEGCGGCGSEQGCTHAPAPPPLPPPISPPWPPLPLVHPPPPPSPAPSPPPSPSRARVAAQDENKRGKNDQKPGSRGQAGHPSEQSQHAPADVDESDKPGEAKASSRHGAARNKRPVSVEHLDAPTGGTGSGGGAGALQLVALIVGGLLVGGVAWWWRRRGKGGGGKVRVADEANSGAGKKARTGLGGKKHRGKRTKGEEGLSLSANVWTEEQDEVEVDAAADDGDGDDDDDALDDGSFGDAGDATGVADETGHEVMGVRIQRPPNGALGLKLSPEAVVIGLMPGGAALRAGLRNGDVVEAVDGKAATGARVAQLLQAGAAKTTRVLRVRRAGRTSAVSTRSYQEDL